MSNALTMFHNNALSTVSDLDAILAKGSQNRPAVAGGNKPFLRLSPDGSGWLYGADNTQVEDGSTWAINPFSFHSGWVSWADPKKNGNRRAKLGEVMGSIANPPPCPTTDYSAQGGEWKEQFGFALVCVSGEDTGTEVMFQTDSYGGKQAFDSVYGAVADRPSPDHCFPVVELKFDSYDNKAYKRTVFTPVFEVQDWANMQQEMLKGGGKAQVAAPAATEVAAPATEEPLVRRRRSAT